MKLFVMAGTESERVDFATSVAYQTGVDLYNLSHVRPCLREGMMVAVPWVMESSIQGIERRDLRTIARVTDMVVSLGVQKDDYPDYWSYNIDRSDEEDYFKRFARPLFSAAVRTVSLSTPIERTVFIERELPRVEM